LEVDLIKPLAECSAQDRQRRSHATRPERHAESSYATQPIGAKQRGVPGDRRTPIMSDHDRTLLAKRIEQSDDVADQVEHRIGLEGGRPIGLPVAALVRSDDVETRVRQGGQLMAPRVPRLRKSVQQYDERTLARF